MAEIEKICEAYHSEIADLREVKGYLCLHNGALWCGDQKVVPQGVVGQFCFYDSFVRLREDCNGGSSATLLWASRAATGSRGSGSSRIRFRSPHF